MKKTLRILSLLLVLLTAAGCSAAPQASEEEIYVDEVILETIDLEDEAVALAASPAAVTTSAMKVAEASGKSVKKNSEATIDYSNTADGYVMVKYTASTTKRLKAQVKGPSTTYTYNLTANKWEVFPLSDGDGSYQVTVYRQASGTKYAAVLSQSLTIKLTDEFAPFLRPNQYVDYAAAPKSVEKAAELTKNMTDPLAKVKAIYNYVVGNTAYDYDKASTVQSGYLPVLDSTLADKKGICFDYAALMTGMLRSQDVPCKLVIGYAGGAYHAWINVYTKDAGWIDGAVYFNGTSWKRLDPTFASSGGRSSSIMDFINNDTNYSVKYLY